MARHRVPVQALRNYMSILFGFAMGGLNNLVILPWAFAGDFSTWGLVRFSAAWATALGPILAFGSSSSMNRFKGRCGRDGTLPQLYGTLAQPGLLLFSVLIVVPALLFPETTADLFGLQETSGMPCGLHCPAHRPADGPDLLHRVPHLPAEDGAGHLRQGDPLPVGYLLLALAVGYGIVTKPQFLPAFIGLYVVVLAVLVAQAVANRFRIDLRGLRDREFLRSLRRYSGTMILGNSAWVILNQIDIIMVGRLMSTEWVPLFAIASFIAAVTQIPQRAITRLWQPLIAEAMDRKDHGEGLAARPTQPPRHPARIRLDPRLHHRLPARTRPPSSRRLPRARGHHLHGGMLPCHAGQCRRQFHPHRTIGPLPLAHRPELDDGGPRHSAESVVHSGFRSRPRPSRRRPRHPHRHGHLHHLPAMGRLANLEAVHPRPSFPGHRPVSCGPRGTSHGLDARSSPARLSVRQKCGHDALGRGSSTGTQPGTGGHGLPGSQSENPAEITDGSTLACDTGTPSIPAP